LAPGKYGEKTVQEILRFIGSIEDYNDYRLGGDPQQVPGHFLYQIFIKLSSFTN
jgi:hypothetical protein